MELLSNDGTHWCNLPDLPEERYFHTQSGLIACGGSPNVTTSYSCVTFSSGEWTHSHDLNHERVAHSAWSSSRYGTILMGGNSWDSNSETTTEVLRDNGKTEESFELRDFTL